MTPAPGSDPAPQATGDRAAAATTNQGIISTGDYPHNELHLPPTITPMDQVPAPTGLVHLPRRSELFVGREQDLARVHKALAGEKPVVVAAVHGLGGIGKSTLAAHYALNHQSEYSLIWWITADSPAAIDAGLAALAVAIQPAVAALPLEQQPQQGLAWLSAHQDWLLILDNLTTPDDAQDLLARIPGGKILITSRDAGGWHNTATPLALDVLTPEEAINLLTQLLPGTETDLAGGERLCEELGYLPLAIEQVGAYLTQTGITPVAYLDLLSRYPTVMFSETGEGGDAQRTMARVWRLTLDRLVDTPEAGQVLRVLAWYAPRNIPRSLLADLADEPTVLRALKRLAAYSMITLRPEHVNVHRLVQAVTRTPDPDDPHRDSDAITAARAYATESLADVVRESPPEDPGSWQLYRIVLPHVQALADRSPATDDTIDTAFLLNECAAFLENQGNPALALNYQQRSTTCYEKVHGVDHPHTLTSRNNLAGAYESAGDLERAIPLYERTLADRERVLGVDHPDTLSSRNNLAYTYDSAGDLERAVPLFEGVVADRERVLGFDHPKTLISRNNLACVYREAGDLKRAISLYEKAVVDNGRALGVDHPNTLISSNNLASAYRAAGDLKRAVPLYETTLAGCERVFGTDHPSTKVVRDNLRVALDSVEN